MPGDAFKTLDNVQWGLTSDLTGGAPVTFPPSPPGGGYGRPPLVDQEGRIIVRQYEQPIGPSGLGQNGATNPLVIQRPFPAPSRLVKIVGYNNNVALRYFGLYGTFIVAPAQVPEVEIIVPGLSSFVLDIPWEFGGGGCAGALSTTPGAFTAPLTADLQCAAIFRPL